MKPTFCTIVLGFALAYPLHAQTSTPPASGTVSPPSGTGTADARKLPNDTLTVGEAKAVLSAHTADKTQLEAERQAMLAKAAKLNRDDRAKLIASFLTSTSARRQKILDDTPRASDLQFKVWNAEKAASAPTKPGTPGT